MQLNPVDETEHDRRAAILRCGQIGDWENHGQESESMPAAQPLNLKVELLEALDHCYRVSEYLLHVLPPRIWHAEAPDGESRSVGAIVAHMQSVRRMFAKMGGADPLPRPLDRTRSTQEDAGEALRESREALTRLFGEALESSKPRVKKMPRRVVNMITYLVQHDAHHRGQICALARALGHRLSKEDVMRIWGWKSLPHESDVDLLTNAPRRERASKERSSEGDHRSSRQHGTKAGGK